MTTTFEKKSIKLTQYSHGAGCGCKISSQELDRILHHKGYAPYFPFLIVGNEDRDDAAVFDLGDGTAVISTTDFFMPIVDDPKDFGRIASVNAISDVYAMGGTPILAIAILGWPVNQLSSEVANEVIEGGREACMEAGIPLAGGHSIDNPEPIFGLAVTGRINLAHLKKNGGATPGCKLYLTKPLGVGILSTAQKKGKLQPGHQMLALDSMLKMNSIGQHFGQLSSVKAMTDVTGFGLLGHLCEMCEASGTSAELNFDKIPVLNEELLKFYINKQCIPGGTRRNWDSYGHKISAVNEFQKSILCDPQTSGGLLVAVEPGGDRDFQRVALNAGYELAPIGIMTKQQKNVVIVN